MKDNLTSIVTIGIVVITIIFIKEVIFRVLNNTLKNKADKNRVTIIGFIKKIITAIIYFIIVVFILSQFSFFKSFIVPLLSGAGIIAVVLGLAAQDTLSNFFSSLIIVFGNPFKIGDFIKDTETNISGTVEEITFRHTVIKTINNRRLIIPNSKMNNLTIENYTYANGTICELVDYDISFDSDINKATRIIEKELVKLYEPNKNSKIEHPKVRFLKMDTSSIKLRAWVWGDSVSEVFNNVYKLNENVKKQFDKNGITIPYAHMNVILEKNKK